MVSPLVGHMKNQAVLAVAVRHARWSLRNLFGLFYRVLGKPVRMSSTVPSA